MARFGEYDAPRADLRGHRGEPVEVVRSELYGLPIPARAELVIEGGMHPGEVTPEGPFGEFTGYYAGGRSDQPVVRVRRVYHRSNPLLTVAPPIRPPSNFSYSKCVMAKRAGLLAAGCQSGSYLGRFVVIVDADIDPTDLFDVIWAVSTRCDPAQDIDIVRSAWSGPLDPRIPRGLTHSSTSRWASTSR